MQSAAIDRQGRLPNRFAECRVRVHADANLPGSAFEQLSQDWFCDQIGDVPAHQVSADDLAPTVLQYRPRSCI